MNTKITLAILGVAVALSMVGTVSMPVATTVFASIEPEDDNDKNDWGEVSSQDAQDVDEERGETHRGLCEHARDPGEVDEDPGREGLGNVGQAVCQSEDKVSPSELAMVLTGGDCPE